VSKPEQVLILMQFALVDFESRLQEPDDMWNVVKHSMSQVFDQTPFMRPVDGALANDSIPSVHLNSSTVYSMDIARSRMDFYTAGAGAQRVEEVQGDFLKRSLEVFDLFSRYAPQRIGFVVRVFYEIPTPIPCAQRLLGLRYSELAPGNAASLQLRYLAHLDWEDLTINSTTIIDTDITANILGRGPGILGIQVTRDFNNVAAGHLLLDADRVTRFVNFGLSSLWLDRTEKSLWTEATK